MSILKRGIATMPVSIHRTIARYSLPSNWHRPSELLPYQPQSSVDLSSWMLKGFIPTSVSTPRGSHFRRTPRQSVRPQVDPRSRWFTTPPRTHLCSELRQSPTMCSSVLTRPPPCRSFRSDEDPTSSPYAILLVRTSSLRQRLLQIVHHLFPCQTCVPQTLQTSQATSDSREALEFHIHGFHREAPSIFRLHLNSSLVDRLSKQSLFIPTHDTITSPQLAQLFILHVFSKHGVPSHVTSDRSMEFVSHFFWSLRTALDMKLHFTSRYHPEGDGQTK